jgi:hypothetical protein
MSSLFIRLYLDEDVNVLVADTHCYAATISRLVSGDAGSKGRITEFHSFTSRMSLRGSKKTFQGRGCPLSEDHFSLKTSACK